MAELIPTLMFYVFAGVTLFSAVMVIASRNPVHSVLFLIFAFFNSAGLFVLLGAEYIAMTLVIVYVGAVAVLFLFVVMMLNINFTELREGFIKYLPVGATVAALIFAQLIVAYRVVQPGSVAQEGTLAIPNPAELSNTHAMGQVLYTDFIFPFQVSGLILLVAMVGAIVLTLRQRPGVRRQKISDQLARKREDAVAVVKVQTGKGA